jgi:hypothetical protein
MATVESLKRLVAGEGCRRTAKTMPHPSTNSQLANALDRRSPPSPHKPRLPNYWPETHAHPPVRAGPPRPKR